jgi:hypothetical protein
MMAAPTIIGSAISTATIGATRGSEGGYMRHKGRWLIFSPCAGRKWLPYKDATLDIRTPMRCMVSERARQVYC